MDNIREKKEKQRANLAKSCEGWLGLYINEDKRICRV